MNARKIYSSVLGITIGTFISLLFFQFSVFAIILKYALLIEFGTLAAFIARDIKLAVNNIQLNRQLHKNYEKDPYFLVGHDVTHENSLLDHPIGLEYARQITTLGFWRLGEVKNDLFVNFEFTNEDNSVTATIRPREPNRVDVLFGTVFTDGFFLYTAFDYMLRIEKKGFQIHSTTGTLAAAYDYHLHQIKKNLLRHGEPISIETIEQILDHSRRYSEHFTPIEWQIAENGNYKYLVLWVFSLSAYIIGLGALWTEKFGVAFLIFLIAVYLPTLIHKVSALQIIQLTKRKRKVKV